VVLVVFVRVGGGGGLVVFGVTDSRFGYSRLRQPADQSVPQHSDKATRWR
jgi:hypothetical protein